MGAMYVIGAFVFSLSHTRLVNERNSDTNVTLSSGVPDC